MMQSSVYILMLILISGYNGMNPSTMTQTCKSM